LFFLSFFVFLISSFFLSFFSETVLANDEAPFLRKQAWRNNNPTYYKFIVKVKRGSPESVSMAWREAIYKL
jgi:hypothetical protein